MKTAYLDAFSGLSGDMIVGALLDAGADFGALERVAAGLGLGGYKLALRRKTLSGIAAIKFDVEVGEHQPERHLGEIRGMIEGAGLGARVTRDAVAIFTTLAAAEAKVHHTTPDRVHFHEVGAVDSIIDVVAAAWGFEQFEIGDIVVSALPMGTGFAHSQHGVIPVPAPATAQLLAGFPVRLNDGGAEMVTPTGAAIVRTMARPLPADFTFTSDAIGYGAGSRELSDRPNLLRLIVGREHRAFASDEMVEIAANVDDLNPQIFDYASERLFAAGARDVTLTPTIMKKGRPGVIVSVLAEPAARERLAAILFEETSTIGIRFYPVARLKLERRIIEVVTRYGMVRVKLSGNPAAPSSLAPEYEDCRRLALEHKVPLKLVMEAAQAAARHELG
ncbi:MAG: nickel pincer cofactor biosynthesis protein LarC [Candidatus Binataceae bacterium]